jgi:hypothetical protein
VSTVNTDELAAFDTHTVIVCKSAEKQRLDILPPARLGLNVPTSINPTGILPKARRETIPLVSPLTRISMPKSRCAAFVGCALVGAKWEDWSSLYAPGS